MLIPETARACALDQELDFEQFVPQLKDFLEGVALHPAWNAVCMQEHGGSYVHYRTKGALTGIPDQSVTALFTPRRAS